MIASPIRVSTQGWRETTNNEEDGRGKGSGLRSKREGGGREERERQKETREEKRQIKEEEAMALTKIAVHDDWIKENE